jgi:hypothetical protein
VNGLTQQFTATGHYSDNSTQDLTTQVTWASSDGAVATVSDILGSNGLATTAGVGITTVSATSGGVTGDTTLTVIPDSSALNNLVAALLAAVTGVGPGHSLADKITAVQGYLALVPPNIVSACSKLDDFKSQVAALSGGSVPVPLANQLTADANAIKAAIPCP